MWYSAWGKVKSFTCGMVEMVQMAESDVVTSCRDRSAVLDIPAIIEAYDRDGYAVIDRLVGEEEVERIRTILTHMHKTNVGFKEGAQFDAAAPDGDLKARRFPHLDRPHDFAKELLQTEYFRKASEIARAVLGDKARFKGDISFMKPAKIGSITPWHQDVSFSNPLFECNEFSIWLALTPAKAINSCMSFIPGSQHYGILPHRPMGGDSRNYALECVGDYDPSKAVECELAPGSCVMHQCHTLHCAGPNLSDSDRLAYVLEFEVPPVLRDQPYDFPWRKEREHTDRVKRSRTWQRRGGFLIHLWRQRRRIGIDRIIAEFRRFARTSGR